MTPQFNGKFAVNMQAARTQRRAGAVRLDEKGADIARFDLCDQIDSAHAIRNAEPRATDRFLISEEYRNV